MAGTVAVLSAQAFEEAYRQAVRAYCEEPTEALLEAAYELGRRASNLGEYSMMQLMDLHRRLTGDGLDECHASRAWDFLMEVLPHFEMKLLGYQEANEKLRRQTAELAVARQEALAASQAKSSFLSSMSHELRTPLNSIIGFTEVLLAGLTGPLTDEQKYQLSLVSKAGSHLLSLVSDLLDLGRIEAGRLDIYPEPFDLAVVISEVVSGLSPLADRKGLRMEVAVEGEVLLTSDRRMVRQILLNIVTNAVKFTEEGGVSISCRQGSDEVCVEIRDTGPGLASEDLGRLFEPFERLQPAGRETGTGLGLYLSRQFAERLGGRITVGSQLGRGSCFAVHLPLSPPEAW
jgi:signal transduction histidine kinase